MESTRHTFTQSSTNALIHQLFKAPIERRVLPNGLTLVQRPDFSAAVVSVQVWVKTGSVHENALIGSGLSHYLEHMLFKGTARRDGKSISREVHALGGGINAYTTFDRTVYYIDAPASAFEKVADILADIVLHSTLPEQEVERERDVILREIDMGLDDPDRQLSQAIFRTAFQTHPYREPVIGHRSLFEQVTRDELYAYYRARYVPNNLVVSVAGAVHTDTVNEVIDAHFGLVPRGRLAPVLIASEPQQLATRREDISADYNIFRGALAFKVPHLSHEDSPRLDALAHALGGGESSLLWQRLRNQKKLFHYIDCRNWNPGVFGLFWISYVCDIDKRAQAESSIQEIIDEVIQNGFKDEDVETARRQALSAEINGRKTMSGQASRLGLGEVVVGDIHYGRRYLNRLQAVHPGDLQMVAKKYLLEEGRSVVTLGPDTGVLENASTLAQILTPAAFQMCSLPGGARMLYQADKKLPKVHIRCVLKAGPMYEPVGQRGISQLMVELLTKDTLKQKESEISKLIESIGGSFSATGGNNTISLAIEVLPDDIDTALDLLENALTEPAFIEETFETECASQVAGLLEEDDEILDYGFRKLRTLFYGTHPFAVSSDGTVEDLKSLTVDAIRNYYSSIVTAPNLIFSVCGDFQFESIKSRFAAICSALSHEPLKEVEWPSMPLPTTAIDTVEPMDREQAVVLQAYPDVGVLSEEYLVGEVLNELFSGMSSRLFERIREDQGMAYYVGSSRVIGLDQSMFVFYAGTHPSKAAQVQLEINLEIKRVMESGVTESELARCRTRLKASRPMGRQTIGARAMHAAINSTYGLPIDDDIEYAEKLDAVDAVQLAKFACKYMDPGKRIALIVGPESLAERDESAGNLNVVESI